MKIVKSISSTICLFFQALGEAKYASHLARHQEWDKLRDLYQK